jgi:hypothetical protein
MMELKIMLIELLKNGGFTLKSQEFPGYEHLLTLRPEKPILVELH